MVFKDYLEDPTYKKCFHNYGFDRHIFFNHGIDVKGFGGDTMHMARLVDPSKLPNQYSLSALSEDQTDNIVKTKEMIIKQLRAECQKNPAKSADRLKALDIYEQHADKIKKINIKETFGFYKQLKDGTEGKILMFPDIEEMHTDEKHVTPWVEYSCFDAEITYFLRETLSYQLCELVTKEEGMKDLSELYGKYWLPFGELLTDLERVGFKVDTNYLKEIELTAQKDKIEYEQKFLQWVYKIQEDAQEFNPSSAQQLQQLLFAPFNKKAAKVLDENGNPKFEFPEVREFRVDNMIVSENILVNLIRLGVYQRGQEGAS